MTVIAITDADYDDDYAHYVEAVDDNSNGDDLC